MRSFFEYHQEDIWNALENEVFTSTEGHVRSGTTARIQRFDMSDVGVGGEVVAVKYLVNPNDKTLSVSGEHDLLVELEQIKKIEDAELHAMGSDARVRVPHPYFYYRKGKIQCYGMELIDGVNLEQAADPALAPDMRSTLQETLATIDEDALMDELELFFKTMHGVCLHGDIKPRNIMLSKSGHLYIIDLGQAVLATSVTEKANEAFEQLKEDEIRNAKNIVRRALVALGT